MASNPSMNSLPARFLRCSTALGRMLLPVPLVLLGGCTSFNFDLMSLLGKSQPPPPPPPLPPVRADENAQSAKADGLAPLPTPQDVLTSVPFGRTDPFAPLVSLLPAGAGAGTGAGAAGSSGGAATPAPAVFPRDAFRLLGVFQGKTGPEALVSYNTTQGPQSGGVRLGEKGGKTTKLLPSGWTLVAIAPGGKTMEDSSKIIVANGAQKVPIVMPIP